MTREEALERIEFRVRRFCPEANGDNIGECNGCWRYPCNDMKAVELLAQERPHGEWVSKPKRVQVDETDEERIFETKLEWFCSSCDKSFGCRKPDDAFCKYCGSDNRKRGEAE